MYIPGQASIRRLREDLNLQFNTLITDTISKLHTYEISLSYVKHPESDFYLTGDNRRRWKDSAVEASRDWRGVCKLFFFSINLN